MVHNSPHQYFISSENRITPPPKRIEFIDLAKGVCILLVIAYHCGLGGIIPGDKNLRMPLYFVLSGLFFKDYGSSSFMKKFNKLLIPYITFFFIGDIYSWMTFKLGLISTIKEFPIIDIFIGGTPSLLPIWFLLCLFNCYIIFLGITRAFKTETGRFISVLLCGLISRTIFQKINFPVYFIDSALSCMPFYYFGYILKKTPILYRNNFDNWNWLIGAFIYSLGLLLLVFFPNSKLSVFDNVFHGNVFIGYIVSICTVLGALLICKQISHIPYISYIGRYSIIILLIHSPIVDIVYYVQRLLPIEPSHLVRMIGTVIISSAFIPFCRKYLPYVTAQKDLFPLRESIMYNNRLFS